MNLDTHFFQCNLLRFLLSLYDTERLFDIPKVKAALKRERFKAKFMKYFLYKREDGRKSKKEENIPDMLWVAIDDDVVSSGCVVNNSAST